MFFAFFFIKCCNNFFTFKISNNICPRQSVFNHKNFFRPIWKIAFRKNIFLFWYYCMIKNFEFWTIKVNIYALPYVNRIFWHWRHVFFKALINLPATINFSSLFVEYISMSFFLVIISLIYYKIRCFYLPIIYLVCD